MFISPKIKMNRILCITLVISASFCFPSIGQTQTSTTKVGSERAVGEFITQVLGGYAGAIVFGSTGCLTGTIITDLENERGGCVYRGCFIGIDGTVTGYITLLSSIAGTTLAVYKIGEEFEHEGSWQWTAIGAASPVLLGLTANWLFHGKRGDDKRFLVEKLLLAAPIFATVMYNVTKKDSKPATDNECVLVAPILRIGF